MKKTYPTYTIDDKKNITFFINKQLSFKMIFVEGGVFTMGDSSDHNNISHYVYLSDYWIGETPVTQEVYEAIMGTNPSKHIGRNNPVTDISWNDINGIGEVARKDSIKQRWNDFFEGTLANEELRGCQFRLPTEAEWEYAAQGGQKTIYAGSNNLDVVGWYKKNIADLAIKPVKLLEPNVLGLYDMSGNVLEWCEDIYSGSFYNECKDRGVVENPVNLVGVKDARRVDRGGSYLSYAEYCRPANRNGWHPSNRYHIVGLRLALSACPQF